MFVFVTEMLRGQGRMNGAKLWPVGCVGDGLTLLLLCVLDKALHPCSLLIGSLTEGGL